jgi:hypothetical protein
MSFLVELEDNKDPLKRPPSVVNHSYAMWNTRWYMPVSLPKDGRIRTKINLGFEREDIHRERLEDLLHRWSRH